MLTKRAQRHRENGQCIPGVMRRDPLVHAFMPPTPSGPQSPPSSTLGTWAIQNARIYPSPDAPPVERGCILIRTGRVVDVGADVEIPLGTPTMDVERRIVTAGFWNAHVHLSERKWAGALRRPAAELNGFFSDMVLSRGFTTVADTGSDPRITLRIRRRIESGDVIGPSIYTAGSGIYPPKGIPYYLEGTLPWYASWFIPQPSSPAGAVRAVERNIARGTDLVKLFTGSYVQRGVVRPMPLPIARAAVDAAHAHHQLVFAHPSNFEGTRVALESGVDILAHAPDAPQGIDGEFLRRVVASRMAMVPTLKMFRTTVSSDRGYLQPIYEVVRRFHELGGELLFGTDVGYMTDYSTEGEFSALAECDLNWREILRMLTEGPALRFSATDSGVIAPGKRADLVILDSDPSRDVRAFARVWSTVRRGQVLWRQS